MNKSNTRNSPLIVDESIDEAVETSPPPFTYRNKEFTSRQLSQLQDILVLELASSIENGYAFKISNISLVDIFENACSKLDPIRKGSTTQVDMDTQAFKKKNSSVVIEIKSKRGKHHRSKNSRTHISKSVIQSPVNDNFKFQANTSKFNFENLPKIERLSIRNN